MRLNFSLFQQTQIETTRKMNRAQVFARVIEIHWKKNSLNAYSTAALQGQAWLKMEFQKVLMEAAKGLRLDEVRALSFLCADLLGSSSTVDSACELFSRLCDQDHLSVDRPHLLSELLGIIQRNRLLRDLALSCSAPSNLVSAYRCPVWSRVVTRLGAKSFLNTHDGLAQAWGRFIC